MKRPWPSNSNIRIIIENMRTGDTKIKGTRKRSQKRIIINQSKTFITDISRAAKSGPFF
jgi:hypothetical protein